MLRLVFDLETDGLLEDSKPGANKTYSKLTRIHCIGALDADTGEEFLFGPDRLEEGLKFLSEADELIGHNVAAFDTKAIPLVYPEWKPKDGCKVFDTMIAAKLMWPGDVLWSMDSKLIAKAILPAQYRKRYSLKAFGYRLGILKGEFAEDTDWKEYSPEMGDYCLQDVRVQNVLYRKIMAKAEEKKVPMAAFDLEMQVAEILYWQEKAGFYFDYDNAVRLLATLQNRQAELQESLKNQFPLWTSPVWEERKDPRTGSVIKDHSGRAQLQVRVDTIKSSRKVKMTEWPDVTIRRFSPLTGKELKPYVGPPLAEYDEGSQFCPVEFVEFNPGSRDHVADRLEVIYGWQPTEFTPEGRPKVDETTLKSLPYPPAADLVDYFVVSKVIGMLAQGGQSWLVNYNSKTHRIHGRMDQLGTVTGRASHSNPNLGQVMAIEVGPDHKPVLGIKGGFGYESRSLFCAPPGWEQTGIDMSGLELRCLAHFMEPYDGGEYIKLVTEGDVHTVNQKAAGLRSRNSAKTMIYALLYGAGDIKLGTIVMEDMQEAGWPEKKLRAAGKKLRANLMTNLPALASLISKVRAAADKGWVRGLDGRVLHIRSAHASLNTVLQSAGAVLSKQWMINLHEALRQDGLTWGVDYQQCAYVHDEIQIVHREGLGERIGKLAVEAIAQAGRDMNFRCPLTGESKTGKSWADCH